MKLMSRSSLHLTNWILSVAVASLSLLGGALGPVVAQAADRPNIVFILTDDQAQESIGAYGNTVCQTPNIDALARSGMVIHDAHHMGSWSGAVCLPSRTMIMTGRTVWRIAGAPQFENTDPQANFSMPALFNAAGYDTFRTCKQGNTYRAANKHFQVCFDRDNRAGDDEHGSAWHAERALDYLDERAARGDTDPFLMFLGFSHPHDPRNGKPELLQKYGAINTKTPPTMINPISPPLPINYLPAHPFPHGHPKLRDETQVEGVLEDRSEATIRNEQGREYACIENIDTQIGRVIARLKETNQYDNTYIFFTADHGIAVGRHGLMGKQNLYEHTWRVPMIVRGPGISPGSQASGYLYLLDVLPTMCDLAGIAVPEIVEGKSFRSVLEGTSDRIRDAMYGCYAGGTKPGMRAIKSDGWKLIHYNVLEGMVRETQLFHLSENPWELLSEHHNPELQQLIGNSPHAEQVNLADDPRYAQKRLELESLLAKHQAELGDPYSVATNKEHKKIE